MPATPANFNSSFSPLYSSCAFRLMPHLPKHNFGPQSNSYSMKQKLLFGILIVLSPALSSAQIGGLINKAKNKVQQRVDNKIDKSMEDMLDKAEGKKTAPQQENKEDNSTDEETTSAKPAAENSIKGYSKFDFIPGERILYTEDFSQDAIGELPMNWNSSGKGEIMTIDGKQGKWLRGFQRNTYLTGNKQKFGENFTVEFDVIYYFEPKVKGYILPYFSFGLLSSGDRDNADNAFLQDQNTLNSFEVDIAMGSNAGAQLNSYEARKQTFHSDRVKLPEYMGTFNKVVHYSLQIQKQRLRLWVNETKVFDIPRAVNTADTLNQLYFKMESCNYQDDEIGFYIGNIKVATGKPDTRHKLIEEGKLSTNGILFDFQSAVIKPESYGVVKEIAAVLTENSNVKIKVIGHTSSDGDDAANLELSKKRAASVKELLVKEFSIDASRIETDGKGETQPVADNKTKEGKAQNRRVEFIKL